MRKSRLVLIAALLVLVLALIAGVVATRPPDPRIAGGDQVRRDVEARRTNPARPSPTVKGAIETSTARATGDRNTLVLTGRVLDHRGEPVTEFRTGLPLFAVG